MLLRFGARNYLSIYERQEISFVASKLKDREEGLIPLPKRRDEFAVPVVVIYGANASGKSNSIAALRRIQRDVVLSHRTASPDGGISRTPFALRAECADMVTAFDVDFIVDNVRYHFGYECNDAEFTAEWLYSFPEGTKRIIYDRSSATEINFGSTFRGPRRALTSSMRPNSLFLSAAVQNNYAPLAPIYAFFDSISFSGSLSVDETDAYQSYSNREIDPRTIAFLKALDTGVVGYRKTELPRPDGYSAFQAAVSDAFKNFTEGKITLDTVEVESLAMIELAHRSASGEDVYFSLARESAGTRRLLVMLSAVFRALETGGVLVVDELDASLHTQAAEAVLALFSCSSTNARGSQLFATTHDTNLMHSNLLRRDEVWFAQKDPMGATHIYPLSDIHTRQTDNIEKGYLQGRYGAIPFSGSASGLLERL